MAAEVSPYAAEEVVVVTGLQPLRFHSPLGGAAGGGWSDPFDEDPEVAGALAEGKGPKGRRGGRPPPPDAAPTTMIGHCPRKGTVTKKTLDILRWSPIQLFGSAFPLTKAPPPMSPPKKERPPRLRSTSARPPPPSFSPPFDSSPVTWNLNASTPATFDGPLDPQTAPAGAASMTLTPPLPFSRPRDARPFRRPNAVPTLPALPGRPASLPSASPLPYPYPPPSLGARDLDDPNGLPPRSLLPDLHSPVSQPLDPRPRDRWSASLLPRDLPPVGRHSPLSAISSKQPSPARVLRDFRRACQTMEQTEATARSVHDKAAQDARWALVAGHLDVEEQYHRRKLQTESRSWRLQCWPEWVVLTEGARRHGIAAEERSLRQRAETQFEWRRRVTEKVLRQAIEIQDLEAAGREALEAAQQAAWRQVNQRWGLMALESMARDELLRVEPLAAQRILMWHAQGRLIAADLATTLSQQMARRTLVVAEEAAAFEVACQWHVLSVGEAARRVAVGTEEANRRALIRDWMLAATDWVEAMLDAMSDEEEWRGVITANEQSVWQDFCILHSFQFDEASGRAAVAADFFRETKGIEAAMLEAHGQHLLREELEGWLTQQRGVIEGAEEIDWRDVTARAALQRLQVQQRDAIDDGEAHARSRLGSDLQAGVHRAHLQGSLLVEEAEARAGHQRLEAWHRLHTLQRIEVTHRALTAVYAAVAQERGEWAAILRTHTTALAHLESFAAACQTVERDEAEDRAALHTAQLEGFGRLLGRGRLQCHAALLLKGTREAHTEMWADFEQHLGLLAEREEVERAQWLGLSYEHSESREALETMETDTLRGLADRFSLMQSCWSGRQTTDQQEAVSRRTLEHAFTACRVYLLTQPQLRFVVRGIVPKPHHPGLTPAQYQWALWGALEIEAAARTALLRMEAAVRPSLLRDAAAATVQRHWRIHTDRQKEKERHRVHKRSGSCSTATRRSSGSAGSPSTARSWSPNPAAPLRPPGINIQSPIPGASPRPLMHLYLSPQ
jgi:hypothetical protein